MTLALQVRVDAHADAVLADFGDGFANDNIRLRTRLDGSLESEVLVGTEPKFVITSALVAPGETMQIVMTIKGSMFRLFVNGVLMALSFFAVRVVGMGLVGLKVFILGRSSFFALHPAQIAILVPIFVFGYGLQLTWFQKIVAGLVAFLRPPKAPTKAD